MRPRRDAGVERATRIAVFVQYVPLRRLALLESLGENWHTLASADPRNDREGGHLRQTTFFPVAATRRPVASLLLAALVASAWAGAARAGEREELEAMRDEIRRERQALADEREALAAQRERVDEALGKLERKEGGFGFDLPSVASKAPQIELDIYGFIHADAIYDINRVDPDWKATLRPSKIPVNCPGDAGCGNDGETILSVRQSRLGFRAVVPTDIGDIRTKFEFELFGVGDDAGETTFRLRHAWAELGAFGAGQTWSLFMDPDVFPNTIDYWGPPGMVFFRNPQVRWTPLRREGLEWAVALESPGNALDQGKIESEDLADFGGDFEPWDKYPDFTTHVRLSGDWGHFQAAAIVRSLGFEIRAQNGSDPDGREIGYALNLSGRIRVLENDAILWQVVGGRGFAGYMNDGGVDLAPNAAITGANAVPGVGWLLYYNRQWAERWTSSIGFGEHRQFTTGGQRDDAFETGQLGQVNLLFHPTPGMYVGPEFIWGRLENENGEDGVDKRVQVSFHYDFGISLFGKRE